MRVLITGGTGFLGREIAARLLADGYAVTLMGRSFAEAAPVLAQGAVPLNCDLRDGPAVIATCQGHDAVIHAGALSAPWGPTADFLAINVGGTAAVLAGCARHRVQRLVYISSPAVIFTGRDHHHTTAAAPYPRRFSSAYAYSKALAELLCRAVPTVPSVILRPKAIFGPGDRALLPRLIAAARAGRLPQIGHGRNLVDLTYVTNVADAAALALTSPLAVGRTYHITNGEHVPLWPLIRFVLRRLGINDQLRPVPLPVMLAVAAALEAKAARTGQEPLLTRYSVAILARTQTYDLSAAQRDLGYQPRISVAAGVEQTLATL
ncbi:MAG: NAD-dependent epimerase/dehydratase family protein [Oscillochloridaceae bacterium umkhey_bin13]